MAEPTRKTRLFRNGANQALRIPREFEFDTEEVTLRREGRRLIVEPVVHETLAQILASMPALDFGLEPFEDTPPEDEDIFK
jgi:antitoxin VapB